MDEILQYRILYTESAILDIEEKADYITYQLGDSALAETWYLHLRGAIREALTTFPLKYTLYDVSGWAQKGIRLFITRNDVVLYSVDSAAQIVYIRGVCTRGRDLNTHLAEQEHT